MSTKLNPVIPEGYAGWLASIEEIEAELQRDLESPDQLPSHKRGGL